MTCRVYQKSKGQWQPIVWPSPDQELSAVASLIWMGDEAWAGSLGTFVSPLWLTYTLMPCMGMGRNAGHVLPVADWGPLLVRKSPSLCLILTLPADAVSVEEYFALAISLLNSIIMLLISRWKCLLSNFHMHSIAAGTVIQRKIWVLHFFCIYFKRNKICCITSVKLTQNNEIIYIKQWQLKKAYNLDVFPGHQPSFSVLDKISQPNFIYSKEINEGRSLFTPTSSKTKQCQVKTTTNRNTINVKVVPRQVHEKSQSHKKCWFWQRLI